MRRTRADGPARRGGHLRAPRTKAGIVLTAAARVTLKPAAKPIKALVASTGTSTNKARLKVVP